jgi:hypothetical protein
MALDYIVATITLDNIVATMALDATVAFDVIVPFVSLLT